MTRRREGGRERERTQAEALEGLERVVRARVELCGTRRARQLTAVLDEDKRLDERLARD